MDIEVAAARYLPDGIIELAFLQENVTLEKNDVEAGWQLAYKLDETKSTPIILKTGAWTLVDNSAREYAITEMKSWPRVSVVVHNLAQKILGSIAIRWMGQSHKIKLFDSETEALKWLKESM